MKRKRRGRQRSGGQTAGVCRDCHELRDDIKSGDWYHASPPRCLRCGGMLDRTSGSVKRPKPTPRIERMKAPARTTMKPRASELPLRLEGECRWVFDHVDSIKRICTANNVRFRFSVMGPTTLHCMFDAHGHRLVDFWPSTLTLLNRVEDKSKTTVESAEEAIGIAVEIAGRIQPKRHRR